MPKSGKRDLPSIDTVFEIPHTERRQLRSSSC